MNGWLLDTNVVSELRRPRPERKIVRFVADQPLSALFISAVTMAEIQVGIEIVNDARRRTELRDWLAHSLSPLFADRVVQVSEAILIRWLFLAAEGRRSGHTYSQPDLLIGATALEYDLIVVSRDTREYRRAQVRVFNPWADEQPPG